MINTFHVTAPLFTSRKLEGTSCEYPNALSRAINISSGGSWAHYSWFLPIFVSDAFQVEKWIPHLMGGRSLLLQGAYSSSM